MKKFKKSVLLSFTIPLITTIICDVFFISSGVTLNDILFANTTVLIMLYIFNTIGGPSIVYISDEAIKLSNPLLFWKDIHLIPIKNVKSVVLIENSFNYNFGVKVNLITEEQISFELPGLLQEDFHEELNIKGIKVSVKVI